ncbi:MAG: hypothetical protein AB7U20_05430 [Planctomycetaceae bacterium]
MAATQTRLSAAAARTLIEAATLAPSGDNVQPWAFDVDAAEGKLVVRVDPTRDPSPMNASQRMSRIAVGAAVHNVLRTAAFNHRKAAVESLGSTAVSVRIDGTAHEPLQIDKTVRDRCTNRKRYDGRPVPSECLDRLQQATAILDGVTTRWVTERGRIQRIAAIVRQADTILFSNPAMRRAFFDNVRFDAPDQQRVSEGLPLAALEVQGAARTAFRLLPKLPDWAANLMQVGASIGRQSEKLVNSASGVCIGLAPDDEPPSDFTVGRTMQQAWLALAEQGLAVQPMMSLLVLLNALQHGTVEMKRSLEPERVNALAAELRETCSMVGDGRAAFLLRFGFASEPTGRTGRLPLHVANS